MALLLLPHMYPLLVNFQLLARTINDDDAVVLHDNDWGEEEEFDEKDELYQQRNGIWQGPSVHGILSKAHLA